MINRHFELNLGPTVVGGESFHWPKGMSISLLILIQSREICSITYLFSKFFSF